MNMSMMFGKKKEKSSESISVQENLEIFGYDYRSLSHKPKTDWRILPQVCPSIIPGYAAVPCHAQLEW